MPVDPHAFKAALRQFASGVTVVTVRSGERIHGMTVSSFCSVALQPPLVLWCARLGARTLTLVQESRVYAVNVLSEEQQWISEQFAAEGTESGDRFAGVRWHDGPATGCPLLEGCLATLECTLEADFPGGDHRVLLGRVVGLSASDEGAPLLYFRSGYRRIARGLELDRRG
ncbi:MAG TPA: flavin reductase family protein [Candidatus Nitrosotenuis sp.]|jgi:flavin reductase (DIM6/NTAB) family NADH-FMN oxidoreductase RutF|nr:flavin reductase family protein [Candidatus Nitrosotenuis sp.]